MNKAILIMGPTASGKTNLVLDLSKYFPIEIISVDSGLIYRDMNIGTAKPDLDDLERVKHHLVNIISPLESYSLANFINDTSILINEINDRKKIPVLVGGTMMYFNSFIHGISKLPLSNLEIRNKINNKIIAHGLSSVYEELKQIDYISSTKININDKQRIVRAIEVYYLTGKSISELQRNNKILPTENLNLLNFAIVPDDRTILHQRINTRFTQMLNQGLIEEVVSLLQKYPQLTIDNTSMRSVGYFQVLNFINNLINYDELLFSGMAATRQLAKRQLTWLRKFNTIDNLNIFATLDYELILKSLIDKISIWNQKLL